MCSHSEEKLHRPWYRPEDTEERNEKARAAYQTLMTVTLQLLEGPKYKIFSDEVKDIAKRIFRKAIYSVDDEVSELQM